MPISETGMAMIGMIAARQLCRKTMMTRTTSSIASSRVSCTALIDSLMNSVGFQMIRYSSPLGKLLAASVQLGLDAFGGGERVGAGPLGDAEDDGVGAREIGVDAIILGAELDPGDVAQARDRAARDRCG